MRVLIIGAHEDDIEFRNAGMTIKFKELGHDVRFLCLSNGNGGHHILSPDETARARKGETQQVAKILGVQYDIWEDVNDCEIEPTLENRKRLTRYIREYNPDIICTHRVNDYHPDHRATAQLVQDASYLLIVPHFCPEAPAMKSMPVIMQTEDAFKNPEFCADVVIDIDNEIETKLECVRCHRSQIYEWLPYTNGETVPESEEEKIEWMKGMNITADTTDEEILAAPRGYSVRFAKVAARFRKELIEKYGEEKGSKVRYAEALMLSEYGKQLTEETKKIYFPF